MLRSLWLSPAGPCTGMAFLTRGGGVHEPLFVLPGLTTSRLLNYMGFLDAA